MHVSQKRPTLCTMTSLLGRPMTARERRRRGQVDGGRGSLILETSVDSSPCQLEAAPAVENRPASMNNGSNLSVDPSCTDEPPLAIDIIVSEYTFEEFTHKTRPHRRSFMGISHSGHQTYDFKDRNWLRGWLWFHFSLQHPVLSTLGVAEKNPI